MNRRKFLRNASLLSVPLFIKGARVLAGDTINHPWLQSLAKSTNSCGKVLVIIQMNGGNDGLNTVIALDKMAELNAARPNLHIPAANTLSLNNLTGSGTNTTTGLHPAMTGLQSLYNDGKLAIVQGVSYPVPNYSHFLAQDIWFSSPATSAQTLDTGWIGRTMNSTYPGYPTGYPNATTQDPLAIQIGGSLPLLLQGNGVNMGYNVPSNAVLTTVATNSTSPAPASDYGTELTFLRMMQQQSNAYQGRISAAYTATNGFAHSALYPTTTNSLAEQLKTVARLIGGGLTTQVYVVNHPDSFDTHVNQNINGTPGTGTHANSLSKLSSAISGFMADVQVMGKQDMVAGMTFSEFGRRVISNTSQGTDHGTAAPVFVFGAMVNGGVLGNSPNLPAPGTATGSSQVNMQYDYRQLYATVLQNWMCIDPAVSQSVLNINAVTNTALPLFRATPLPAQGIEATGVWQGNEARIDFLVYNNSQYERFDIERSVDGSNFERVGVVQKAESRLEAQPYRYTEGRISARKVYYRIAGIGYQNTIFSRVVELTNEARAQAVQIYPNPVTDFTVYVDFLEEVNGPVEVSLYDMQGSRLYFDSLTPQNRRLAVKIPHAFGTFLPYIFRVKWEGGDAREQISFI